MSTDEATVFEKVRAACALIAAGDSRAAAAVLGEVQRQAKGGASLPLDDGLDTPLWGATEIGAAIGTNPRKTYHLLEHGLLPATKVGKLWCTTKRKLLARVLGEDGFVPPPKPAPKPPPLHVPKSRKKKLRPPPKLAEPPPRVARSRKRRAGVQ